MSICTRTCLCRCQAKGHDARYNLIDKDAGETPLWQFNEIFRQYICIWSLRGYTTHERRTIGSHRGRPNLWNIRSVLCHASGTLRGSNVETKPEFLQTSLSPSPSLPSSSSRPLWRFCLVISTKHTESPKSSRYTHHLQSTDAFDVTSAGSFAAKLSRPTEGSRVTRGYPHVRGCVFVSVYIWNPPRIDGRTELDYISTISSPRPAFTNQNQIRPLSRNFIYLPTSQTKALNYSFRPLMNPEPRTCIHFPPNLNIHESLSLLSLASLLSVSGWPNGIVFLAISHALHWYW